MGCPVLHEELRKQLSVVLFEDTNLAVVGCVFLGQNDVPLPWWETLHVLLDAVMPSIPYAPVTSDPQAKRMSTLQKKQDDVREPTKPTTIKPANQAGQAGNINQFDRSDLDEDDEVDKELLATIGTLLLKHPDRECPLPAALSPKDEDLAWLRQSPIHIRFRRRKEVQRQSLSRGHRILAQKDSDAPQGRVAKHPKESMSQFVCRLMVRRFLSIEPELEYAVHKHNWFPLFARLDRDGSGLIELCDLKHVIRRNLSLEASVLSDACIEATFREMDVKETGRMSASDFAEFMRRQYCSELQVKRRGHPLSENADVSSSDSQSQRDRVLGVLKRAFGRVAAWFGGDWYPLVTRYDRDARRTIEFEEVEQIVRDALKVDSHLISNDDIESLLESCRLASNSSCWPTSKGNSIRLVHFATWMNKYARPISLEGGGERTDDLATFASISMQSSSAVPIAKQASKARQPESPRWDFSTSTPYSLVEGGQPIHTFDDFRARELPTPRRGLSQRVLRDAAGISKSRLHHYRNSTKSLTGHESPQDNPPASRQYVSLSGRFECPAVSNKAALASKWVAARKLRADRARSALRRKEKARREMAAKEDAALVAAWDAVVPCLDEWRLAQALRQSSSCTDNKKIVITPSEQVLLIGQSRKRSQESIDRLVSTADPSYEDSEIPENDADLEPDGSLIGYLACHWESLRNQRSLDLSDLGLIGGIPSSVFALLARLDSYDLSGNALDETRDPFCSIAVQSNRLRSKRRLLILPPELRLSPETIETKNIEAVFEVGSAHRLNESDSVTLIRQDGVLIPKKVNHLRELVEVEIPGGAEARGAPPSIKLGTERVATENLRRLSLPGQRLDGRGLSTLLNELGGAHSSLRDLNLAGCRCGGTLVGISAFVALEQLLLNDCDLGGPINEVFSLTRLNCLSLHHNLLDGSIEPPATPLPDFRDLFLHHNAFTGVIPIFELVARMPRLRRAWFDHNQFDVVPASVLAAASHTRDFRVDAVVDDSTKKETEEDSTLDSGGDAHMLASLQEDAGSPSPPVESTTEAQAEDAAKDAAKAKNRIDTMLQQSFSQVKSRFNNDWHSLLTRCDRDNDRGVDKTDFISAVRRELHLAPDQIQTTEICSHFEDLLTSIGSVRHGKIAVGRMASYFNRRILPVSESIAQQAVDPYIVANVIATILRTLPHAASLHATLRPLALNSVTGEITFRNFKTFVRRSLDCSEVSDRDLRDVWRQIDTQASGIVSVDTFVKFVRKLHKRHSSLIENCGNRIAASKKAATNHHIKDCSRSPARPKTPKTDALVRRNSQRVTHCSSSTSRAATSHSRRPDA